MTVFCLLLISESLITFFADSKIIKKKILYKNKNFENLFKGDLKLWPIYVTKKPIKSIHDNVFYLGDAFYTFVPALAQGASQSIESGYELFNLLSENKKNIKNLYFKKRAKRTKQINKRSKFNYFAFHISSPLLEILRNFFLRRLIKNKNFIENYLGKIYQ